ncbi:MAG: endonuclease/exonuclease/phosphatase family protein, partial [Chthoniobacterales bacterium]
MSKVRPAVVGVLGLLLVASGLFGQSSPWPFPSRPPVAVLAPPRPAFSVGFWNIQWFPGGRPNAYKKEVEQQVVSVQSDITKLAADVIGFEEVRDWASAELAVKPLPGFKVDVCSTFPPREGQTEAQQVAIVSRLQPISAWSEEWKADGAIVPPRGFAFAAYEFAPGQLLLVYVLHLKSNRGELVENVALREESMRQLLAHMKDMENAYAHLGALTWIVGGDFNTAPDDKRFATEQTTKTLTDHGFLWSWQGMPLAQRETLPADERF